MGQRSDAAGRCKGFAAAARAGYHDRRRGRAAADPWSPEPKGGVLVVTRRAWLAVVGLAATAGLALAADPKMTFEVYQDAKDQHRWRLKAEGKVLATSGQGYKAKADLTKAIDRIKSDAATKLKFELYEDKKKEHRFRIVAANGQTIGASGEGHKAKADAEKAVETIKKGAKDAEVVETKEKDDK
jgi:uncharacterized protein YegP (UPF0339 family)